MAADRDDFSALRTVVHQQMGGPKKVRALRLAGKRTAREHIDAICDSGSFVEIGTFVAMGSDGAPTTAGDGRICGHGTVDDVPVVFIADDVTVKRASGTMLNARKTERAVHLAKLFGAPIVFFGESSGGRLPDILRGDVFASEPIYSWLFDPQKPPLITAIVGESYGGSSFIASMSDITIMLEGSVLAITSPRVIEVATGARVSVEELGGAEVMATRTGLVDAVASDLSELDRLLRKAVDLLARPIAAPARLVGDDVDLRALVPVALSQGYDMRVVIEAVVDIDSFFELGRRRGRAVLTGLARIDGRAVGVVASQPENEAGALSPTGCEKATEMTRLCERFSLPIVCLVDTPGFQIGPEVEHNGMLQRAMDLIGANTVSTCPVVTVILRKAFGLAFFAMFSPAHGGDMVVAWPDAKVGFMAPEVAANVLYGDELGALPRNLRSERLQEYADSLKAALSVRDVAAAMGIDEIIEPSETVEWIRRFMATCPQPGHAGG
jgi:acetyl-CoA carboxylase carboxyltransferase component